MADSRQRTEMLGAAALGVPFAGFVGAFASLHGESVQQAPISLAMLLAAWWTLPLAAPVATAGRFGGVVYLVCGAVEAACTVSIFTSESSTAGIGLVTIPLMASVATLLLATFGASNILAVMRRRSWGVER